jgi:hypothetical protein
MEQVEPCTVVLERAGNGGMVRDRPIEHLTYSAPRIVLLNGSLTLFDQLVDIEHQRAS